MGGSGGENCQWSTAVPGATAQKPMRATLNGGPLYGGLSSAPEAKAAEPGGTILPRKLHGAGPLHTSFCSTASKTVLSGVTVPVSTHDVAIWSTLTFCSC